MAHAGPGGAGDDVEFLGGHGRADQHHTADAAHRLIDAGRPAQVPRDDLRAGLGQRPGRGLRRVPHQHPDGHVPLAEQARRLGADLPGRGQENHVGPLPSPKMGRRTHCDRPPNGLSSPEQGAREGVETKPAHRPRLPAKGERTRARIIEAAAALIYERGVAGTSLDYIRSAARVSGSQLSHYFAGKDELVQAVIGYQAATITGNQRQPDLGSPEGLRAWRDMAIAEAKSSQGQGGCPLGSLAGQLAETDPQARAPIAAGFWQWSAAIGDGLRRLHAAGHLPDGTDPDDLAVTLLAALQGGLLLPPAPAPPPPPAPPGRPRPGRPRRPPPRRPPRRPHPRPGSARHPPPRNRRRHRPRARAPQPPGRAGRRRYLHDLDPIETGTPANGAEDVTPPAGIRLARDARRTGMRQPGRGTPGRSVD